MNCKKIFAAVAAFAMLSASVTGYAAVVNTTTTYNGASGKVEVATAVSGATADSEVTYIVKSGGEVVYIDQDTAKDGTVNFSYKITQTKIAADYSTSVKFGSSETDVFEGVGVEDLGIKALPQAGEDLKYTITYQNNEKAVGYGEYVTATVVADEGYEITAIYIDGKKQETVTPTVQLTTGQTLTADTRQIEVTPGVECIFIKGTEDVTIDGETDQFNTMTTILTPIGNLYSVGVVYRNEYYKSYANPSEISAVKIIFPKDATDYSELTPAYQLVEKGEVIEVSASAN